MTGIISIIMIIVLISPVWALIFLKYKSDMHHNSLKEKKFILKNMGNAITAVMNFAEREHARQFHIKDNAAANDKNIYTRENAPVRPNASSKRADIYETTTSVPKSSTEGGINFAGDDCPKTGSIAIGVGSTAAYDNTIAIGSNSAGRVPVCPAYT